MIVFTAGHKTYAESLIRELDPSRNLVSAVLTRDHCYLHRGRRVKNLACLGRDLDSVVLVDNSIEAMAFDPDNGVLIKPFLGDENDRELLVLLEFLEYMRGSGEEVRSFLRRELGIREKLENALLDRII